MFIIHKNWNKTSIRFILKLNSISFMFNNNFFEMNIKKVTLGGGPVGRVGIVLISSWNCDYQYLLVYPSILLGYPSNIYTCIRSIGSWCVISLTQHVTYLWPSFPNTLVLQTKSELTPLFLSIQSWNKVIQKEKCFSNTSALLFLVIYVYLFFK